MMGPNAFTKEFTLILHPVLESLFQKFEMAGVRWCLLRLPAGLGKQSGDIDVLIDDNDVERVRQLLKTLEFVQVPNWGYGLHFIRYHMSTDQWLWLHIVTELSFGPGYILRTQTEAECLTRRQCIGEIIELAPDDAFWVLLLHCILDKRKVALRHRVRLQELVKLAQQMDGPLVQVIERVCPPGWSSMRITECVRHGDWLELEHLAPLLTATWMRRDNINKKKKLHYRALRLLEKTLTLRHRRGLSVALLGPDGAGKSTLVTGIQDSFIFPVRTIYMGLTGGSLEYISRLRLPGLVILSRLLIFWCRYLRAQYHQTRGRLVIFERYIYDAAVPHPNRLNWLRKVSRWVDGHACPAPDLVLVLNAPGEIMYARKGEYSPEQLEDWRQHFLALQHRITELEIVDATRTKDEVRADAIARVWRRYVIRWRDDCD